jgi:serine/threonine-protein kinase
MPTLAPSPKSTKSLVNQAEAANPNEGLPSVFERYLLLKRIAKGGMGEVFLATASGAIEGAERPCVVKVIREEHAEDASFVARFLDEARIQSQLEHPGVVRVISATHDELGKPYVVLEHVEGRNLSEVRLRVQQMGIRLAWPDGVAIALGLAEALAHIHERTDALGRPLEIVHRDLSPQNVMVAYGGDVKLIDFGTARGQNRKCHTVSGIVFAKPGYVAPEVANNQPGGIPADLYAIGIMLWELLAGRRFIAGDTAEHLAQVAAGTKVVSPVAELVNAPPELDLICQRLTATKLEDRYESAREAVADLVQLLKRAPNTSDGQRSVRVRIAQLMQRLYPAEPTRTRAEFQRLLAASRHIEPPASALVPPPSPPPPATADNGAPLLAGTRYELGARIGEGASGVVFDATHVDLARPLAIKLFNVEGKVSPLALETFRREARLAAQLAHENIVRVHDFGTTTDGQVFLAMERLEGQSLERHLSTHGALEYRSALLLTVQICRALEAAHEQGIVHGDLKPQNLFITRQGTVKLLDFGVSALYREPAPKAGETAELMPSDATTDNGPEMGEAFALTGTPEYLAPEQLHGHCSTKATDQYALGVVLYEMLTASRPHEAESMGVLLGAKLSGTVEAPSLRAPASRLPKTVDRLCLRLLASEPTSRYEDVATVRVAIEAVLDASSLSRKKPGHAMRYAAASTLLVLSALGATLSSTSLRHNVATFGAQVESDALATLQRHTVPMLRQSGVAVRQSMSQALAALEGRANSDTETRVAKVSEPVAQPTEIAERDATDENANAASVATPQTKGSASELTVMERALKNDKPVKVLELAHQLAAAGNHEPKLYRLWVEAATRTRAFGEAHRAAKGLVSVEPSAENEFQLAQLERRMGRNEAARHTLEQLLVRSPDHKSARTLLDRLEGNPKVASR